MAERHSRMLAKLAELSLGLAESVQAEALAAEAPEDAARLTHAFGRAAHAVRQCIALEAKLAQDAARAEQASEVRAEARQVEVRERRAAQVRITVGRVLAAQAHGFERERLLRELDHLVDEGQLFEDFADAPLETQLAILCDHLALSPEEVDEMSPFRPDPPDFEDDDDDTADDQDEPADDDATGAGPWDGGFDAAPPTPPLPPPAWRGAG